MNQSLNHPVLAEALFGDVLARHAFARNAALMCVGVLLLTICAKISIPMWPVPVTMGTFAVLTLGAAYGPRLGLATIGAYMALGALGFNVFAGSGEVSGWAYMTGTTGGYLLGYVFAVALLGYAARTGQDRNFGRMALALLAGNIVIYLPGLLWLGIQLGFDKPILQWGLYPFLIGDALKLALAACVLPLAWQALKRS